MHRQLVMHSWLHVWVCLSWMHKVLQPFLVLSMRTLFSPISPGIPSISELTFNATTRTLTCISTGGPATTVIWRMGRSELTVDGSTYQFMQTLTDGTTSTYSNVLTIVSSDLTSILGSIFTCEVENSRGTATMNITIPCKNNMYSHPKTGYG